MSSSDQSSVDWEQCCDQGLQLRDLYLSTTNIADLERSIQIYEDGLATIEEIRLSHTPGVSAASGAYLWRFERTGQDEDITRAIFLIEKVIQVTPKTHAIWPRRLVELGLCLGARFAKTKRVDDCKIAITLFSDARRARGDTIDARDHIKFLAHMISWYTTLYTVTAATDDYDAGTSLVDEALSIMPDDMGSMSQLADTLLARFRATSAQENLDHSISVFARAFELESSNVDILLGYADSLRERFEYLGNIEDLELAITTSKSAVELAPSPSSVRLTAMQNNALCLARRFQHTGRATDSKSIRDLDEALSLTEQTLREAPMHHDGRPDWLEAHGNRLGMRFEATGDGQALDEAIRFTGEAVVIVHDGDSSFPNKLANYGNWLFERFLRTSDMKDLNKAIDVMDRSVSATSESHRNLPRWEHRLGTALRNRAVFTGDSRDLDQAIAMEQRAVDSTAKGDIDRPFRLAGLADCHSLRYGYGQAAEDINIAIDIRRSIVETLADNHPSRPEFIAQLASSLYQRAFMYRESSIKDLDDVIQLYEESLKIGHKHPKGTVNAMVALGKGLRLRAQMLGCGESSSNDIDRSIDILREVLDSVDIEDFQRASILLELGNSFVRRHNTNCEDPLYPDDDGENALQSYLECFRSPRCPVLARIISARNAAGVLVSLSRPIDSVALLKEAIDRFPSHTPRFLTRADQQRLIGQLAGIATWSTAVALDAGAGSYEALMLLEGGRGVMASLLMENSMDVSTLGPDTASQFLKARERLKVESMLSTRMPENDIDGRAYSGYALESQSRFAAEEELQCIIENIRNDAGTRDVFKPPTHEKLIEALEDDTIVVINTSPFRSDAFVINKHAGCIVVNLAHLKLEEVEARVHRLRSSRPHIDPDLLEWLWDTIAEPILEQLGFHESRTGPLSRIIWVPTGSLTGLPIHAAGRHSENSKRTVMDRVISSYSSTLRSFVHSKRTSVGRMTLSTSLHKAAEKAVLIAMGTTPGNFHLRDLPFATTEVDDIEKMCQPLNLDVVRLPVQSREAVLAQLDSLFFHFAGHGISDTQDPAQSGLCLEDGLLTVADIQSHSSGGHGPFLGYLSACRTAANEVDKLADEGIHLLSACQLAGFRHVIGALWQVYDSSCAQVSQAVYKSILAGDITDRAVCVAFHAAILGLRNAWVADAGSHSRELHSRDATLYSGAVASAKLLRADWVPYIHYGP